MPEMGVFCSGGCGRHRLFKAAARTFIGPELQLIAEPKLQTEPWTCYECALRARVEVEEVLVMGFAFEVPKILMDEHRRLMAVERKMQDEQNAARRPRARIAEAPRWVPVDDDA